MAVVDLMLVAAVGPMTAAIEAVATSIGAGMLLGGFVVGLAALLFGVDLTRRDRWAVDGGSSGGLVAVLAAVFDVTLG